MSSELKEYVELNESAGETRTGEKIAGVRREPSKMFAIGCARCPVNLYKVYADKRLEGVSHTEDPIYLAPNTKFDSLFGQWYIRQIVCLKKLGKMLKVMAECTNSPGDKRLTI